MPGDSRVRGLNPAASVSTSTYLDFFSDGPAKSILNALGSVGRDKSGKMEMTRRDDETGSFAVI